jgi:hypothetical protein
MPKNKLDFKLLNSQDFSISVNCHDLDYNLNSDFLPIITVIVDTIFKVFLV